MPVPRVAGRGPGRPRARARMLLRPRPDRAIRAGAPRCSSSHETLGRSHRHPGAARPSGTRGRRSDDGHPRHRRIDDPPPPTRRCCCKTRILAMSGANSRTSASAGGGGQNRPAGEGRWRRSARVPSGRPAVGCRCSRPSAASGGRQRGAAPGDVPARSQRRRVRGRRSMRRPSDTAAARGAKQTGLTQ